MTKFLILGVLMHCISVLGAETDDAASKSAEVKRIAAENKKRLDVEKKRAQAREYERQQQALIRKANERRKLRKMQYQQQSETRRRQKAEQEKLEAEAEKKKKESEFKAYLKQKEDFLRPYFQQSPPPPAPKKDPKPQTSKTKANSQK